MAINIKKFDNEIISFLKKQPQKYGDISHIVNEFVNGDDKAKHQIRRQLHFLRTRDIIIIKDLPEDTMQMQDDWWGNFPSYNPTAGYQVEGLSAQLGNGYLNLSWKDKFPVYSKLLDYFFGTIFGILITFGFNKIKSLMCENKIHKQEVTKKNLSLNTDSIKIKNRLSKK